MTTSFSSAPLFFPCLIQTATCNQCTLAARVLHGRPKNVCRNYAMRVGTDVSDQVGTDVSSRQMSPIKTLSNGWQSRRRLQNRD